MADQNTTVVTEDVPREETLPRKLNDAERYWVWKAGARVILCVLNIVGIGCAAWVLAHPTVLDSNPYLYYFEFNDSALGAIIVLGLSLVWCLIWVTLPTILKPPRPLHPGIAVGIDLLFWMGYLVVALFTLAGLFGVAQFGSDPTYLADPSSGYHYNSNGDYSGSYYLASNGTWVYNITSTSTNYDDYYYNRTTGEYEYETVDPSTIVRDCTPEFATCAEQDQFINDLWHEKPKRLAIEIVVNAIAWLGTLLHFGLFVWACVDTHRYNRTKYVSRERQVADRIIADLEKRGLITVQDGIITQAGVLAQPPTNQQAQHQSQPLLQPPQNGQPAQADAIENSPRWA